MSHETSFDFFFHPIRPDEIRPKRFNGIEVGSAVVDFIGRFSVY
ncbi:MAG: hypothetical protein P8165_01170 [Deltaproteobacteria bacterium]